MPIPTPEYKPAPGTRPDDARYLKRLSPEQVDYYRWLRDAENLEPDAGEDADDALTDAAPQPAPHTDPDAEPEPEDKKKKGKKCVSYPTPRKGGHAEHDAYALVKSGSAFDWYARGPSGAQIAYDGKTPRMPTVWEVKVRHGWFYNCKKAGLTKTVLARWAAQRDRGLQVASECGYSHIWACKEPRVAAFLRLQPGWSAVPIVS
jgi:hypothetical protein